MSSAEPNSILIQLHDRRQFVATLVGEDVSSDLALVEDRSSGFDSCHLGRQRAGQCGLDCLERLEVPYGFQHTVTSGIISGKNRPGDINHPTQSLLQTGCCGESREQWGGPLVDAQGQRDWDQYLDFWGLVPGDQFRGSQ